MVVLLLAGCVLLTGCQAGKFGMGQVAMRATSRPLPDYSSMQSRSSSPTLQSAESGYLETASTGTSGGMVQSAGGVGQAGNQSGSNQSGNIEPTGDVVQVAYQQAGERVPDGSFQREMVVEELPRQDSNGQEISRPPFEMSDSVSAESVIGGTGTAVEGSLTLEQLLQKVVDCYPEIDIAVGAIETAQGKTLESMGEFDDIFSAHSISQPLGFYQTYQNGAGITRPLFGGGEVYGTYRIGDGNFEPWFGERETNEGGEFKAGFSLPLLKDRDIDKRRAVMFTALSRQDQVGAEVNARLLQLERLATQAYWQWVASGRAVLIQRRLLALAETRTVQIRDRIDLGELADLDEVDNNRFIANRRNDLIKAERELEKAAIKMSLFYRDANCDPVIAGGDLLPGVFPETAILDPARIMVDIDSALALRPELASLGAEREQACIALELGRNDTLPKIDLKGFAGQDIGGETSSTGDKTPFELQLGLLAEVPLQRRAGLGRIAAAQGKLRQIDAKIRLTSDKIRAEVQDAASAVNAAAAQVEQSAENVRLARRSLEMGRELFDGGDVSLIELNIYETSAVDAELKLLDAQFKYFISRVVYETATTGQPFGAGQ